MNASQIGFPTFALVGLGYVGTRETTPDALSAARHLTFTSKGGRDRRLHRLYYPVRTDRLRLVRKR